MDSVSRYRRNGSGASAGTHGNAHGGSYHYSNGTNSESYTDTHRAYGKSNVHPYTDTHHAPHAHAYTTAFSVSNTTA